MQLDSLQRQKLDHMLQQLDEVLREGSQAEWEARELLNMAIHHNT